MSSRDKNGSQAIARWISRLSAILAIILASTARADATQSSTALHEKAPPAGKGTLMSEEQIQYCLAQLIRIEAIRPEVDRYRKDQVEYFNALTADYNSRCETYTYKGDARENAKTAVEAARKQIETNARSDYLKRFAPEAISPALGDSVPAEAKQSDRRPEIKSADTAAPTPNRSLKPLPAETKTTEAASPPRAASSRPPASVSPAPDQGSGRASDARKPAVPTNEAHAILGRFAKDIRRVGTHTLARGDDSVATRDATAQIDVYYATGGYIRSIVVGESSGEPLLDERAVALARSLRFPDVPSELRSRDFAIRFPIVFRN